MICTGNVTTKLERTLKLTEKERQLTERNKFTVTGTSSSRRIHPKNDNCQGSADT